MITYLGLGLIAFGLLLFVIRQMSSDNPQNQTTEDTNKVQPVASNNKSLTTPTQIPLPFNAFFAIYTNNTFRIFDNERYHNLNKNVYIQSAQNPNRITVTTPNVTWGDFFNSLPMQVSKDCLTTGTGQNFCTSANASLRFFINEQEDSDALSKIINSGDRLLITYGGTNAAQLQTQFDKLNEFE